MTSVHKMQMGLSAYNLQIVDFCLKNCSSFFTMCACVCVFPSSKLSSLSFSSHQISFHLQILVKLYKGIKDALRLWIPGYSSDFF